MASSEEVLTLKQLQREHEKWQAANFPNEQPYQPLLGLVEEVGELAHAHLKGEQKIRSGAKNDTGIQIKKTDAVGDIVVYLAGYCSLNGIDLQDAVQRTWEHVSKRNWVADPVEGKVAK